MAYHFIALDLDGTLTNSKKEVSPHTVEVLRRAAKRGVRIILASGRPEAGIFPVAETLGLRELGGYILAYNGSRIIDCKTGQDILRRSIPAALYPNICESYHRFSVELLTYGQGGVIAENPDDLYVRLECRINRIEAHRVAALYPAIEGTVCKFLAVGVHERLREFQRYLREHYPKQLNVFFSETYFLEIVPPGIEKAASLETLLHLLGGDRSELIACGDGLNDITMIDYAGLGVAMENAQPSLRDRADYITDTNDNDGVAQVVEKFLLRETPAF